jgi:ribosome-binding protein aMBF1 (putative translation factor)
MARCAICKQTSDEIKLFEGIFKAEMINICKECAESEGVPIIQKPSESQLDKADERYTVRERMEIMSGMRNTTEISEDQTITQGNLAKLKVPPKKQFHEDVLDNYYWTLNIARRRKKLTINQLANQTQIPTETIQAIEKGKIPEDFETIFQKLELFLDIKLLKNHKKQVHFLQPTKDEADEILRQVKEKMDLPNLDEPRKKSKEDVKIKKEQLEKLSKGEIDFSKRENLSDVTLNDLVEMKKQRERKESSRKSKAQEEAMLGDDLELEEI